MLKRIASLRQAMNEKDFIVSLVGAFIATLLASFFSDMILIAEEMPLILASTGASAILIFSVPLSPVSQPWNLVGGHVISAFVGVSCYIFIPNELLASSFSIFFAMLFMHVFRCMHPPGGATAITAVVGGANVHALGYAYIVLPVFVNSIILLSVAMAVGMFREVNPFEVQEVETEKEGIDKLEEQ